LDKPLLIFDGDCGFCRMWILRWKRFTRGKVDYAPSQEVGKNFPEIPESAYQKAVQLVEPDGRRSSAAEAVFRALKYGGFSWLLGLYEKLPGFAPASEFVYGIIAGHRPTFSTFTRWLWGNPAKPSSYRQVRWIFLRSLSVIYGIAFWSFGIQVRGLVGAQGILPAQRFLAHMAQYGAVRFWYVPTLAWLNAGDRFLVGLCVAGFAVSILVFLNIAPRWNLAASWILYLSLVSVGGDFMNFQWDALLLETGFLAIFLAPAGFLPQRHGASAPPPAILFLLRWLLFRLMFQSALVKWWSGDPLWRHFTALTVHYQTQPLPNAMAWYAHQLPVGFQKLSCLVMFGIEALVPFFIFTPRRSRLLGFWALVGFQGLILFTGNYAFFNLLAITLCFPLLDDTALRAHLPAWCEEPISQNSVTENAKFREGFFRLLTGTVLYLTIIPFGHVVGIQWPQKLEDPALSLSYLRSFNSYGLFAVMTPKRPEIILEGSNDAIHWIPYEFKYKPGDPGRPLTQVAPYQPRLDWQMWFAALGDYQHNLWFINFCLRILQGSEPVARLMRPTPFPGQPPLYLRAMLYDYRFTTVEERKQTGKWWVREVLGLYCPVLSLKKRVG
jgi:predicted DCC family thiol-disulfide oxidoreductase YuxK